MTDIKIRTWMSRAYSPSALPGLLPVNLLVAGEMSIESVGGSLIPSCICTHFRASELQMIN